MATSLVLGIAGSWWLVPAYLVLMGWLVAPAEAPSRSDRRASTAIDPVPADLAAAAVPDASPTMAGVEEADEISLEPAPAEATGPSTRTRAKRTRGRTRSKAVKDEPPADSTPARWVRIGPGKFVRVESSEFDANPALDLTELPPAQELVEQVEIVGDADLDGSEAWGDRLDDLGPLDQAPDEPAPQTVEDQPPAVPVASLPGPIAPDVDASDEPEAHDTDEPPEVDSEADAPRSQELPLDWSESASATPASAMLRAWGLATDSDTDAGSAPDPPSPEIDINAAESPADEAPEPAGEPVAPVAPGGSEFPEPFTPEPPWPDPPEPREESSPTHSASETGELAEVPSWDHCEPETEPETDECEYHPDDEGTDDRAPNGPMARDVFVEAHLAPVAQGPVAGVEEDRGPGNAPAPTTPSRPPGEVHPVRAHDLLRRRRPQYLAQATRPRRPLRAGDQVVRGNNRSRGRSQPRAVRRPSARTRRGRRGGGRRTSHADPRAPPAGLRNHPRLPDR